MYVNERVRPQPGQSMPLKFLNTQRGGTSQPQSVSTLSLGVSTMLATTIPTATRSIIASDC